MQDKSIGDNRRWGDEEGVIINKSRHVNLWWKDSIRIGSPGRDAPSELLGPLTRLVSFGSKITGLPGSPVLRQALRLLQGVLLIVMWSDYVFNARTALSSFQMLVEAVKRMKHRVTARTGGRVTTVKQIRKLRDPVC